MPQTLAPQEMCIRQQHRTAAGRILVSRTESQIAQTQSIVTDAR